MVKAQLIHAAAIEEFLTASHKSLKNLKKYGLNWSLGKIQRSLKNGGGWLCYKKNKLVGALLFVPSSPEIHEIHFLLVTPSLHKKGVGGALFSSYREELLRQRFRGEIWLELHEDNYNALIFYKAQGFQVVGKRRKYYSDGGAALLMSLQVL